MKPSFVPCVRDSLGLASRWQGRTVKAPYDIEALVRRRGREINGLELGEFGLISPCGSRFGRDSDGDGGGKGGRGHGSKEECHSHDGGERRVWEDTKRSVSTVVEMGVSSPERSVDRLARSA